MRGVPQSGLWSEEAIASSGTGSERAEVASVALGNPPRARVPGRWDADHQKPYSFHRRVTRSTIVSSIRMSSGHSLANPSEAHFRVASIPIFEP